MIEKGADPSIFAQGKNRFAIKLGLVAMGAAVGSLIGQLLYRYAAFNEEVATISMVFFFGGLGLVIDHFLAKKEDKEAK